MVPFLKNSVELLDVAEPDQIMGCKRMNMFLNNIFSSKQV